MQSNYRPRGGSAGLCSLTLIARWNSTMRTSARGDDAYVRKYKSDALAHT